MDETKALGGVNPGVGLKALMLREPRLTLAVAESLTSGHVQARVGAIPGASLFFLGGVTAYTLEEKVRLLGVERELAKRVNCVSAEVATQMAAGVCRLFGSTIGLATTGYAEPSPAEGVAAPFAWWALVHSRGGRAAARRGGRIECAGAGRVETQVRVAEAVMVELEAYLHECRGGG